jgi:hypothetical protein
MDDPIKIFREDKERREREQEEQRQKAAIEFLEDAKDAGEFDERRNVLRRHVWEPNAPLDEMSMSDFVKVRNKQARNAR